MTLVGMALALVCLAAPDTARSPLHGPFSGLYRVDDDASVLVRVWCPADGPCQLVRPGRWAGAGRLVGDTYSGHFRSLDTLGGRPPASGTHVGRRQPDGSWLVTVEVLVPHSRATIERWIRVGDVPPEERGPMVRPEGAGWAAAEGGLEHPVWPPPGPGMADSSLHHPIWPPPGSPPGEPEIVHPILPPDTIPPGLAPPVAPERASRSSRRSSSGPRFATPRRLGGRACRAPFSSGRGSARTGS